MTISEWPNDPSAQVLDLTARLGQETNAREFLEEALADLQFAAEDAGWQRLGTQHAQQFTREGLRRLASNCRVMAVAAPLIKRGLVLRVAYVWGQGVTVAARAAGEDAGQDVNAVIQQFWDDPSNKAAFTSSQAQEELERTGLGCDGNVFLAAFTNQRTGRVQVRSTPFDEVRDIITNPEDRDEPWFYLREWDATVVEPGHHGGTTRTRNERRRQLHPDLRYRPRVRPRSINGIPVAWDAPMLHVSVNRLDGWKFGVGDAYAALEFARFYDGFLVDWARLVKSLSKFAWRATSDRGSKASKAAASIKANAALPAGGQVGGAVSMGPGQSLEAIPKSGATIDSESGRPLAAMVAAALGVPVTMLLADPGVTGARATAETLDKPTILEMGMRRTLWRDAIVQLLDYVIDQAVKAPAGPLRGVVGRDDNDREVITLAGDVERTVEVEFPPLDDLDPKSLVEALEKVDGLNVVPPLVILRLVLAALRVKNADEIIAQVTDDDGNFVDPTRTAGDEAVEAWRRGQDPADRLA